MRLPSFHAGPAIVAVTAGLAFWLTAAAGAQMSRLTPGTRVLLDAHNAYPYDGKWSDRLERALATGLPIAIEQDLIWRADASGRGESVVAHDEDKVAGAPTFEQHFFDRVRPLLERVVRENRRGEWPVLVLNLDVKTNEPAHHAAIWEVLGRHEAWLTTATRTDTPDTPSAFAPGPLLVLTGSDPTQQVSFHDTVPVGGRLRLFGAIATPQPAGDTPRERALVLARMSAETLIPARAGNYRRWVNFPWLVVEAGGQTVAGDWSAADRARLDALVRRAHTLGLWIRFYTLNGHSAAEDQGWSTTYNFGSLDAARRRWDAVRAAGVDFIATDQYAEFAEFTAKR